jgi:hypothetical protein
VVVTADWRLLQFFQEFSMPRFHKPNPYCAFKDDIERRKALMARDIRLVFIAVFSAVIGVSALWKEIFGWINI